MAEHEHQADNGEDNKDGVLHQRHFFPDQRALFRPGSRFYFP
jgi:hypothetical protein